jgi:hypothetical protein
MALITVEGDGVSLIFEEISAELAEAITTKRINEAVFDGLTGATHYDSLWRKFSLIRNGTSPRSSSANPGRAISLPKRMSAASGSFTKLTRRLMRKNSIPNP